MPSVRPSQFHNQSTLTVWLKIVNVIKNAVAAGREGNWDLHVATLEDLLALFSEFDCPLYLGSTSFYYEQMKTLKKTHPYLFR